MPCARALLLLALLGPLAGSAAPRAPGYQDPDHHVLSVGDLVEGDGPTHVVWTPDGTTLLVLNAASRNVAFLEGGTPAVVGVVTVGPEPLDLEVTPDGRFALVPNSGDRTLSVVDLATRTATQVALTGHVPHTVVAASDSSFAVVASYGGMGAPSSVSVVDLSAMHQASAFDVPGQIPHPAGVNGEEGHPGIALAPDDRTLLVPVGGVQELRAFDVLTGALVGTFVPDDATFQVPIAARVDPSGQRAALLCADLFNEGWFEVFSVDLASWQGTAAGIWFGDMGRATARSLDLTPDGTQALVAGMHLHFFDLASGVTVSLDQQGGAALAVSSDGATAVVGPQRWLADEWRAFDVATQAPTGAVLRGKHTRMFAAHPLDSRVAALEATEDEDVALLDTAGGGLAALGRAPTGPGREGDGPTAIAVDPTGTIAVSANEHSDNLTLFDLRGGVDQAWIEVHDRPMDVRLFDAGRTALVWHADGEVSVVDVAAREVRTRFPSGVEGVGSYWWEPKPERIAPIGDHRALLYGRPFVVTLELDDEDSRVLGRYRVPQGSIAVQAPTLAAAGIAAFPQANPDQVHLVDVSGPTGLYSVVSVAGPRALTLTAPGYLYVGGGLGLQRFQVNGLPKDMGVVDVGYTQRLRVDEDAGFAYLVVGLEFVPPMRLVVVDVATMKVVADLELPELAVDLELAAPHAFVALRDGTLLRFRADGANTQLLSSHPTRGEPLDLVVAENGRTVLLVKRELDEIDAFQF